MNELLRTFSVVILILFTSYAFVGCEDTKQSRLHSTLSETDFNEKNIEKHYQSLPQNKQWGFIKSVIDSTYKNTTDVESWLLKKIALKKQDTTGLSVSVLKDINTIAFDKDYLKFTEKIARFTLSTPKNSAYSKVRVYAVASLSHLFNTSKENDSLKKYVDLLYHHIKTDTTKSLHLIYHANKANLESMNGDFFQAAVNYHKAIELTESFETIKKGTLYHNLATMYLDMNYLDKAKIYIDSSLHIITFEKYPTYLYNSLGIIQSKTKDYVQAEKTFQTIIQLAKEKQMTGLLAQSYANYANLKRRKGDFDDALHYIRLSDSLCNSMGIDFGVLINQINKSEVFYNQKKYEQAAAVMGSIEDDIKKYDLPEINKEYYGLSYQIYEALGNFDLSNAHFRIFSKYNEQITGDLPRSVISEWELSREREQINKLNFLVNKQKQQNYFYGFIISLLLLAFFIIYFFVKKKYFKFQEQLKLSEQKAAFELEMKSKELLTSSLKNISIQQSKSMIKEDLECVIKDLPVELKAKFNGLKTKLDTTTPDSFLLDFENRFVGIYESFYQKLKLISPDLTPNETIICAMLRLNYSSKEIAYLTNRTVRTIENNRSIIRKKLQLDADINLQQYLLNL